VKKRGKDDTQERVWPAKRHQERQVDTPDTMVKGRCQIEGGRGETSDKGKKKARKNEVELLDAAVADRRCSEGKKMSQEEKRDKNHRRPLNNQSGSAGTRQEGPEEVTKRNHWQGTIAKKQKDYKTKKVGQKAEKKTAVWEGHRTSFKASGLSSQSSSR